MGSAGPGTRFGILANGDLVDGDHHNTPQLVSHDPNVQMWILKKMFETPLLLKPDFAVIVRGTEAHVGKGAATEESFARWLAGKMNVIRNPKTDMYSWWHFDENVYGCRIDAAHHGRIGTRPWTLEGAVHTLAHQIVLEHANRGDPIPDIAIRSHFHTFVDSGPFCRSRTRLMATPAWQLHTAHAHRVVPECLSDIGGLILTIEPGAKPVMEPVIFAPEKSPPIILE